MSRGFRRRPPVALTIAASDSGGGAGIQADLRTFAAHGVYGASVLTGVTAQNTRGILACEPVSTRLLRLQLQAVFTDLEPAAVKIGALFDAARVRRVAAALERWRPGSVVLDPVLAASTGEPLLAPAGLAALKRRLLPLCHLVTPNLREAEALAGIRIRGGTDRRRAAGLISDLGPPAVLIKGGHARGRIVSDLLFDGRRFYELRHRRIATRATHGTGCVLSSAIAANLALGRDLRESVERAITFLQRGLREGVFPGAGRGVARPL